MIVMIVCTVTGLVLLTTEAAFRTDLSSTTMCMEAFRIGFQSPWAGHVVSITLFFFAFTTILTWSFCASRAMEFIFGAQRIRAFQLFFIAIIPVGAFLEEQAVWTIADFSINLMFIINMVGVIGLANMAISYNKNLR
jgi:AGCS family alanine or glycine:cation symporter